MLWGDNLHRVSHVVCFVVALVGTAVSANAQNLGGLLEGIVRSEVGRQLTPQDNQPAQLSRASRIRVQQQLQVLGYPVGPADGIFGPSTRREIAKWQRDNNQQATGNLTASQFNQLAGSSTTGSATGSAVAREVGSN
ncbi:MAG: peptidoglycan-binding domain-containing protein [Pseudomonadota bacterium]